MISVGVDFECFFVFPKRAFSMDCSAAYSCIWQDTFGMCALFPAIARASPISSIIVTFEACPRHYWFRAQVIKFLRYTVRFVIDFARTLQIATTNMVLVLKTPRASWWVLQPFGTGAGALRARLQPLQNQCTRFIL